MQMETERLLLRPILASDASDVFAYSSEAHVGPNAGWKPHESLAETEGVLRDLFLGQEGVFGIVLRETGRLVGSVGTIADPKRQNPQARMLGYALSEAHWGKGLMTEAVRAVLSFCFAHEDVRLISAYCYPENRRSKRLLQHCGFVYEGCLRDCELRYDGRLMDNECYALYMP